MENAANKDHRVNPAHQDHKVTKDQLVQRVAEGMMVPMAVLVHKVHEELKVRPDKMENLENLAQPEFPEKLFMDETVFRVLLVIPEPLVPTAKAAKMAAPVLTEMTDLKDPEEHPVKTARLADRAKRVNPVFPVSGVHQAARAPTKMSTCDCSKTSSRTLADDCSKTTWECEAHKCCCKFFNNHFYN